MKWSSLLFALLTVPVVTASPALVWQKSSGAAASLPLHTSQDMAEKELLQPVVDDASLQIIFVIDRKVDGSESLTSFTATGSLPGIAEVAPQALAIHHSVSVLSASSLTKVAQTIDETAIRVGLDELKDKIENCNEVTEDESSSDATVPKKKPTGQKRARAIANAKTLIVDVPASTDPAIIDEAVVDAIEREFTVTLTAVRSVQEVKLERSRQAQAKLAHMTPLVGTSGLATGSATHRRLEDADAQENQAQQNARQDQQELGSIYYVSMTPNIMAGLLFFFLFVFIGLVGFSCMGMIAGQDVYVKKMPSIGREA
jgi:hypothetical protein